MQRFEHMSAEQRGHARALFHAMRGMDAAARKAFGPWSRMSGAERGKYLFRIARLLAEAHSPAERVRAQTANDFIVFGTVACTAFGSGLSPIL